MKLKDRLLKVLSCVESTAKTTRAAIVERDECPKKLALAKSALELIMNADCHDHLPCTSTTMLKRIAMDALQQLK